ncbi:hypothetical protein IWW37_001360 [Coemansia sp. RSA 2050]|nr:hypothetical protein IWW37_001360 [Coemansia sp. RSA 2050]
MSDDSDAGFMSFASAPGQSNSTALAVHESSSDRRHRRSRKKRRSDEPRERNRHRSTHREERKAIAQRPVDVWEQLLEDGVLSVDRRGDANLLMFKETSKSTAPRFVRRGGSRVLGLSGNLRVESEDGLRIYLVRNLDANKRYMDVDWKSQQHAVEHVEPIAASSGLGVGSSDFVPLATSADIVDTASKTYDSDSDIGDGYGMQPDFRSIEGRAKDPSASRALAQAQPIDGDQPIVRSEVQTKVVELERLVRANPHDVSAWQTLAQLQESLVASMFSGRRRGSKRTIAESQIEVYKRALGFNPESRPLILGYLSRCSAILDDTELAAELERILESTSDPKVIVRYAAMHQTMSSQFSVSKVTDAYVKCIRRVQRVLRDKIGGCKSVVQGLLGAVVDLVHCFCLFLREAGYAERAIAVFQALVEWYALTPERLFGSPFSHRRNAFERFWDSGVPRIGMAGARGWCCYDNTCAEFMGDLQASVAGGLLGPEVDPWDAWCRAERNLAEQSALPVVLPMAQLKSALDGGVDLNSLVVFEDVESFIVDLPWSESAAGLLLDRLFQFLGVVGPHTFVLSGQLLRSPQVDESLPTLDDFMWTIPGSAGGACESMLASVRNSSIWGREGSERRFPFVSIPITLDTCDSPLDYAYSCPWIWQQSQNYLGLASNSFELLTTTSGLRLSSPRMRLLLATAEMEWSFALPSFGMSVAKRILKTFPTCLALWNTYAKLHARYGWWEEARNIWASILVRAEEMGGAWAVVVRKSWVVLEIIHGRGVSFGVRIMAVAMEKDCQPQELLQRLLDAPSDVVSAVDVLRARKLTAVDTLDCSDDEITHAHLALRMWLAYAAEGSCDAALQVYRERADTPDTDSALARELAMLVLCSIHLHHSMKSKVYRALDLRSHLEQAVHRYPHNTVFWEMYVNSESRSKMFGRVGRQVSIALVGEPRSPYLHLLGLYVALAFAPAESAYGTVCGALRRATCDAECWSPLVWMTCIAFEVRQGLPPRGKRLLLGAMRRCPWVKPLYLAALGGDFKELAELFGVEEKKAILQALVFLGLRTRVILADDFCN